MITAYTRSARCLLILSAFVIAAGLPAKTLAFVFSSSAPQAALMDAETGALLYGKETHVPVPPSSMTKLMTVYVLFDHIRQGIISKDDTFIVSEEAWKKGGSKMFVKYGDRVKVDDLLRGIIVQSGNDACIVAAEGIASTEPSFAGIMNTVARKIGLTNSHFMNASGWPEVNHYMSVYDIATLSRRIILDFPEFYEYFSEPSYTYNGIKQNNRNRLLGRDIGVDGLKTGHTDDGGYGIAVSAEQDGRRLIAVVNGLTSDRKRIDEAEKLLQYGFRYFENRTLYEQGAIAGEAELWLGLNNTVSLKTDRAIIVPVSKLDGVAPPRAEIVYNGPIDTPVEKDTEIAELHIYNSTETSAIYPLFTAEKAERAGIGMRAIKRMNYFIKKKLEERRLENEMEEAKEQEIEDSKNQNASEDEAKNPKE